MPSKHQNIYQKILNEIPSENRSKNSDKRDWESMIANEFVSLSGKSLEVSSYCTNKKDPPDAFLYMNDDTCYGLELIELVYDDINAIPSERDWSNANLWNRFSEKLDEKSNSIHRWVNFDSQNTRLVKSWILIHVDCMYFSISDIPEEYYESVIKSDFDKAFIIMPYKPNLKGVIYPRIVHLNSRRVLA